MASQSASEMDETERAPLEDRGPPRRVQYDISPDPDMDSREAFERYGDPTWSQEPSPQNNPQPQDPNQGSSNVEGSSILPELSFLRKLWRIVEDDTIPSVHWNENGDTVIIEEDRFQREVLCRRGEEQIFESDSLKSFIRLMNLSGFVKIRPSDPSISSPRNKIMIYRNSNFQRDKPWLFENIKRKGNQMTGATPPKRKKRLIPTRHFLKSYQKEGTREADPKAQRKPPNAWGPSDTGSFTFSDLQSTSNAMDIQCPSEPGGPSGEGTSWNVTFVPPATAGSDGTGGLPTNAPGDPFYDSVMCLYNTCYSLLIASLSAMNPSEDEEEGSSDYKTVYCESIKDDKIP
ncbi:heat shock transcription factor, X-linked member 3-like [Molossus nigricans]